jgi:hypothetical protein
MVGQKGMIEDELATTEALLLPIEQAFEAAFTLGGLVSGMAMTEYVQGDVPFGEGDPPGVGFTVTFVFKERRATTLSG